MNLRKGLIISAAAHACVVFLLTIQIFFFEPTIIDVSQAVRVDMVDLPDKLSDQQLPEKIQEILRQKETPPINPEPEEEDKKTDIPEPKKELPVKNVKALEDQTAVNIKKVQQKQKNALQKLKKLSAIEKIKEDLKNSNEKKSLPIKGRVLSAGSKIAGLDKLQSDEYLTLLDSQIKTHWSIPQWMIGKPFKATVWVKLDPNGKVIMKQISKSSGNPTYDEYCLSAVEKASPFPPVPDKFTEVYKADGVSFAFPD